MTAAAPQSSELLTDELQIIDCGLKPYAEIWELQKKRQQQLIAGTAGQCLIVCEHNPVVTIGRSGKRENLRLSPELLAEKGIEFFEVERGGDVTYHAPGQLVLYPILDLARKKKDVGWYMRCLEEVVIRTLSAFKIEGCRVEGRTGVWLKEEGPLPRKKIASLGIRISRWCTMHGLALNVFKLDSGHTFINPCGFQDIELVSMEQALDPVFGEPAPEKRAVQEKLVNTLLEVFGYEKSPKSL